MLTLIVHIRCYIQICNYVVKEVGYVGVLEGSGGRLCACLKHHGSMW